MPTTSAFINMHETASDVALAHWQEVDESSYHIRPDLPPCVTFYCITLAQMFAHELLVNWEAEVS